MVFRRITRIIEVVLNERAVVNWFEPDAFYLKESVLFFILKM